MSERHPAVCYTFREGAFSLVREAKPFHNDFGLNLFQYKGAVHRDRTGLQFCFLEWAEDIASVIGKHGGLEEAQKLIADSLERTDLSPRYTRPNEKRKDIFPPKEKDENRMFVKDLVGNKYYYYRFYNENGIEPYTMEKKREFFQTVYVPRDSFIVGINQRYRSEEVLRWLSTLEHGIRDEIERAFSESMGDPKRWADLGPANLLGWYYKAERHNIPLEAERRQWEERWVTECEIERRQREQEQQARYDAAIQEAEKDILAGKEVINREVSGKALIMQLFREHEIPAPLKTQGQVADALHSVRYFPESGQWDYRYYKKAVTV